MLDVGGEQISVPSSRRMRPAFCLELVVKPRPRDRAPSASALRRKLAIVSRLAKCIVLGQRDFSSCGLAHG
jgi:hypothetical protein